MVDIAPQGWVGIGVSTGCMTLATTIVGLRFLARKRQNLRNEIDDWITLLALFLLGTMFVAWILYAARFREGRHVKELLNDQVVLNLKGLFALQLTYTFTVPTVKISILLFYRRIFVTPRFQIASMVLIGCCVCWFIAIFLLDLFQCNPVQRQWDRSIPGSCINDRRSFVANGIFNILIDFATLLLPMPVIWNLRRSWQDRVALMGIFALGGFVCITTILRTIFLSTLDETDVTYTISAGATWSFVEPAVGLVCGSLPMMRVFFPHMSLHPSRNVGGGGKSSSNSSKPTYNADTDNTWPRSYEMMPGNETPFKEPRTDSMVRAERGEANRADFLSKTHAEDREGAINVQKEIIVR